MANGTYEYLTEFARKYVAQGEARGKAEGKAEGKAQGKAEALLAVVAARGLPITAAARAQVLACTDVALLDRWIARAVVATSVEEILALPL